MRIGHVLSLLHLRIAWPNGQFVNEKREAQSDANVHRHVAVGEAVEIVESYSIHSLINVFIIMYSLLYSFITGVY